MADSDQPTERQWLDSEAVCRMLGLKSRGTLDDWARQGKGPPFYRIGRMRQYDAAEVGQWLREQRVPAGWTASGSPDGGGIHS